MAMGNVDNMPPYDKFGWFYLASIKDKFKIEKKKKLNY